MYIAIKNDDIYQGTSLYEIIEEIFDINVTDEGFVIVDGKPDSISYNVNSYNRAEMLADFMAYRAKQLLIAHRYELYKKVEL